MEPRHERIARIALTAGARYGLALAGGYAVSAHGMGNRPSGDVDLFTSWQRRGEFPELTAAVVAALEGARRFVSMRAQQLGVVQPGVAHSSVIHNAKVKLPLGGSLGVHTE